MVKDNLKTEMTKRSPFFYVGDKYKLMPQLKLLMPDNINNYIEPFVGGGSSLINMSAKNYIANDLDYHVVELHKYLLKFAININKLFKILYEIIDEYSLSCSFIGRTVSDELKKKYVKTYYSVYNKESYNKLKTHYNKNQDLIEELYILLIYGFNHMIRFNQAGEFNLPVGNVDFNKNVVNALNGYIDFAKTNSIQFYSCDYKDFLDKIKIRTNDYVFLDPPYYISLSEYNKFWSLNDEKELYDILDGLDKRGIRFGITNLVHHKGKTNEVLKRWAKKYYIHNIKSNYISFNDNTIKNDSKEVFVTNYEK